MNKNIIVEIWFMKCNNLETSNMRALSEIKNSYHIIYWAAKKFDVIKIKIASSKKFENSELPFV